ncbi:potassium channel family protein [uncultured Tateyamaria sp.]|uniref:potassium channel family protein n=1 Tax=Tateyamaria sp. TaxID=1929288 RepID=UPI0026244534|nr:potassium channel family protein [uncultured Tateyamaria sp.]
MGTPFQILIGTGLLALCALLHVSAVSVGIPLIKRLAGVLTPQKWPHIRIAALLSLALIVLVVGHTAQIWVWSVYFMHLTDLPDVATSFYFATVTYTTLGYGDIVLDADTRIVGTFCAITGLLTFGISTAFLMGVLVRVMPDVFRDD